MAIPDDPLDRLLHAVEIRMIALVASLFGVAEAAALPRQYRTLGLSRRGY